MSMSVGYGSHLPFLIRAMELSDGPVAEVGMGYYSTPYLHWKTHLQGRKLVSWENDEKWMHNFDQYQTDWHTIIPVKDWDEIDIGTDWGLVFIDHVPKERRIEEIKRFKDIADYIVIHDTEGRRDKHYHYTTIFPLFQYRKDFSNVVPHTSVVSNRKKLDHF